MKKYINLSKSIILVMIIGILLAACSKIKYSEYGLDSDSPTTITVWHYYNGAQKTAFDNLIVEFNETVGKEKGIVVEAFSQGGVNDLIKMLKDSAMQKVGSNNMPDLFATYVDTAKEIDNIGLLASLDKYYTQKELSEYVHSYIEEGKFDEDKNLKIIPIAKSTEVLMINKTDWDKFSKATGATEKELSTWENITNVAEKYYNYSGGKAFFGRDVMANYILIGSYQLGHELFKVENDEVIINLNKDAMRKIWDNFYVPFVNGYFGKYGKFASDDAKTGDVIAFIGSSSGSTYFPTKVILEDEKSYPIELLVLPLPTFKGTSRIAVQQGAGFAVTKNTETKEYASTVFLKWITDADRNLLFSSQSSYLPVKTRANDYEYMINLLKVKEVNITENVEKTLNIAIEQTKTYELYTSKAFNNGTEARKILEKSLLNKALEDKEKIKKEVDLGGVKEEIIEKCNNESFESWFNELEKVLNVTIYN